MSIKQLLIGDSNRDLVKNLLIEFLNKNTILINIFLNKHIKVNKDYITEPDIENIQYIFNGKLEFIDDKLIRKLLIIETNVINLYKYYFLNSDSFDMIGDFDTIIITNINLIKYKYTLIKKFYNDIKVEFDTYNTEIIKLYDNISKILNFTQISKENIKKIDNILIEDANEEYLQFKNIKENLNNNPVLNEILRLGNKIETSEFLNNLDFILFKVKIFFAEAEKKQRIMNEYDKINRKIEQFNKLDINTISAIYKQELNIFLKNFKELNIYKNALLPTTFNCADIKSNRNNENVVSKSNRINKEFYSIQFIRETNKKIEETNKKIEEILIKLK